MSTAYELMAIETIVHALKAKIPEAEHDTTPTPIIAAPGSWLRQVAKDLGAAEGEVPASIHNCDVFQEDGLPEPVMITHDEKVYRVRQAIEHIGKEPAAESEASAAERRTLALLRQTAKAA